MHSLSCRTELWRWQHLKCWRYAELRTAHRRPQLQLRLLVHCRVAHHPRASTALLCSTRTPGRPAALHDIVDSTYVAQTMQQDKPCGLGRARLRIERWLRWLQRCEVHLRWPCSACAKGQFCTTGTSCAARLYAHTRRKPGSQIVSTAPRASRVVRPLDNMRRLCAGQYGACGSACAKCGARGPNSAPTEPPRAV